MTNIACLPEPQDVAFKGHHKLLNDFDYGGLKISQDALSHELCDAITTDLYTILNLVAADAHAGLETGVQLKVFRKGRT